MRGTLYCIVALNDPAHTSITIRRLQDFTARLKHWNDIREIYVSNSDAAFELVRNFSRSLRPYSPYREFSAWQEGLDHYVSKWQPYDGFLFLNDTAFTKRIFKGVIAWGFRVCIDKVYSVQRPVFVGEFDNANVKFTVKGLPVPRWASTYFFFMNGMALSCFDGHILQPDLFDTTADIENMRLITPHASEELCNHISRYLLQTGENTWRNARPLTKDNAKEMTTKASAILNELYITAYAIDRGIECIDILRGNKFLRRMRGAQYLIECWLLTRRAKKASKHNCSIASASTQHEL